MQHAIGSLVVPRRRSGIATFSANTANYSALIFAKTTRKSSVHLGLGPATLSSKRIKIASPSRGKRGLGRVPAIANLRFV